MTPARAGVGPGRRAARAAERVGVALLVLGLMLLPLVQEPWWQFFHSTLALLGLWGLRHGRRGPARLGLAFGWVQGALVLAAGLAFWRLSGAAQGWIAAAKGLRPLEREFPEDVDPVFQALNEEMVLGWLLLVLLARVLRGPHATAWCAAVVFAAAHLVCYRCGTPDACWLAPATLATLLFVGAARAYLILVGGHVGWAWALHAGWNVGFFGAHWYTPEGRVGEAALLDAFLGHGVVLGLSALLALLGAWLASRRGIHPRVRAAPPCESAPPAAGGV